jgi:hypothetical protein
VLCTALLAVLWIAVNCVLRKAKFPVPDGVARPTETALVLPMSTEPTARPVGTEDLVGRWQFYVDGISRTVVMDFRADGTFGQTILPNHGARQQCPGGTWRLDGAAVHLDGYITAAQGDCRACAWRIIDDRVGFALYCGDGPDAQAFFCVRREEVAF